MRNVNANALSRKPCRQCGVEDAVLHVASAREEAQQPEVSETITSIEPVTLEDAQKRDVDLSIVRVWLKGSDVPPNLEDIQQENGAIKTFLFQREKLHIGDGILCRETFD